MGREECGMTTKRKEEVDRNLKCLLGRRGSQVGVGRQDRFITTPSLCRLRESLPSSHSVCCT
jgi:hypothetical protein